MPRVPRFGPQVSPAAMPKAFQTAQVPEVGAGLRAAGRDLGAGLERLQEERDTQVVLQGYTEASDRLRSVLYDREAGAYATQGEQAVGLTARTTEALDRIQGDLTGRLTPRQQQAFAGLWAKTRDSTLDGVARHEAAEHQRWKDQTTKAVVASAVDDATMGYRSEGAFGAAWTSAAAAILANYGGRDSAEAVQGRLRETKSALRLAVLDRIIAESPADARAYYDAHQLEIEGQRQAKAAAAVRGAGVEGRAQAEADTILAAGGDVRVWRSKARAITDPAVRTATLALVEHEESFRQNQEGLRRRVAEAEVRGLSQVHADAIMAGGGGVETWREKAKTLALDRDDETASAVRDAVVQRLEHEWTVAESVKQKRRQTLLVEAQRLVEQTRSTDALTGEMRAELPEHVAGLERRARDLQAGREPVHDSAAWVEFRALSPTEVLALGPEGVAARYRNRFDNSHFDRALELADAYRAQRDRDLLTPEHAATLTFDDRVRNALAAAKVVPAGGKLEGDAALRLDAFETEAARRIAAFEVAELGGKRKATGEEMQSVIDRMVREKVRVKEWGRDPTRPAAALQEDERGKTYVPLKEIPDEDQIDIKADLDARGISWTPRQVERVYAVLLTGGQVAVKALLDDWAQQRQR